MTSQDGSIAELAELSQQLGLDESTRSMSERLLS